MGLTQALFGTAMGVIDVFAIGAMKAINLKWISPYFMIITTILYALQPWVFFYSLNYDGMIIMNMLWDLISTVLVTILGFLFFKETVTYRKFIGVILSFISICLLACD